MTAATTVQSEPLAVGVDGCRAGWIAVARGESRLDYQLHTTFSELLRAWPSTATVFVDIPIGLPSRACPSRRCDTEARQRLGSGRASSVFSPPCRGAACATNLKLAREINSFVSGRNGNLAAADCARAIPSQGEQHPAAMANLLALSKLRLDLADAAQ